MQRFAVTLSCGLALAAILSFGAAAAGRGGVPMAPPGAGIGVQPGPAHAFRASGHWRGIEQGGHRPHRRRLRWIGPGYPWLDAGSAAGGLVIVERQVEEPKPVDRDAFENLTARAGIRRGPVPEPTIYRLEGPRQRPAARVIRIAGGDEAQAQPGRRSRFAHAETGALLLIMPSR